MLMKFSKQRSQSIENRVILSLAQDEPLDEAVDTFHVMLVDVVNIYQECGI
jgi:hypothetical protein